MEITKRELKKHISTIHCSNALSLLQRKVSNALLFYAYEEMLQKEEHEITIKQLCTLINYSGHNYLVIKDALKGLISTVMEWNVVSDQTGEEDWTASSILASVRIKGPLCYYAYSPRMKQLLHCPSIYGKINLMVQAKFRSSYGLALYENCIRYKGLPTTKWFDYITFRKLMGVPDDKYQVFRDFKRRVLDKSVGEVNEYADLSIEPQIKKQGRGGIAAIRFLLKSKNQEVVIDVVAQGELEKETTDVMQSEENSLIKRLMKFGLTLTQTQKVMNRYSIEYIESKIQLVEASKNYKSGKIDNIAAYAMSALLNDYQTPFSTKVIMDTNRIALERERENSKRIESERLNAETNYKDFINQLIDNTIINLEEKEMLEESFREYISAPQFVVYKDLYVKYGLTIESSFLWPVFRGYVKSNFPNFLPPIPTFEEYLLKLAPLT